MSVRHLHFYARRHMLTIINYGTGHCMWCLVETEGVQAEFRDGLKGFLCRKHFWQALKIRSELSADQKGDATSAAARPADEVAAADRGERPSVEQRQRTT